MVGELDRGRGRGEEERRFRFIGYLTNLMNDVLIIILIYYLLKINMSKN